jgi:hypothetical protein
MDDYTIEQLRSFLDRDEPLPDGLNYRQIRERLEEHAVQQVRDELVDTQQQLMDTQLRLEGTERMLENLRCAMHAIRLTLERELTASWSCKQCVSMRIVYQQ